MRKTAIAVLVGVTVLAVPGSAGTGAVASTPLEGGQAPSATHVPTGDTAACDFPVTVTDATGAKVTVEEEPQRVVVLAPSSAQIMWEISAREKVVGMPVNEYTASLDGAQERTNVVGADNRPVQSKVVDLEPDLVLAPNIVKTDTVRSLRRAGQTVYRFRKARSMADVTNKTELTGRLVGEVDAARRVATRTRGVVGVVREAVGDRERPKVYYALGGGWTAGKNTFIDDLISTAGGRNIAAEAGLNSYKQMSAEVVATRDPDWIVIVEGRSLPNSPALNGTTAVEKGQILRVNPNFINQPGPRTTISLRRMAEAFHPEVTIDTGTVESNIPPLCGAGSTQTPTATAPEVDTASDGTASDSPVGTADTTEDESGTPDATSTAASTPTAGASGPGYTVGLALVALAVCVLVGRRI